MKKTVGIVACLLFLPMATMAAQTASPPPPTQASIDACVGKAAGDMVKLPGKNGKMISATCKDVKGQLVAVPKTKKKKGTSSKTGETGKTMPTTP